MAEPQRWESQGRWVYGPAGEMFALQAPYSVERRMARRVARLLNKDDTYHEGGIVPVGAVEIAARMRVKRATVDQWRQRDIGFPEPRWTVGGRPAWDWTDVTTWADQRTTTADVE